MSAQQRGSHRAALPVSEVLRCPRETSPGGISVKRGRCRPFPSGRQSVGGLVWLGQAPAYPSPALLEPSASRPPPCTLQLLRGGFTT